jgi:hypothetical protein
MAVSHLTSTIEMREYSPPAPEGVAMEFFLQWADELDDLMGVLRHLAPKILAFIAAIALFALTGFALLLAPGVTLAIIGLVLSASLVEAVRRRRAADSEESAAAEPRAQN